MFVPVTREGLFTGADWVDSPFKDASLVGSPPYLTTQNDSGSYARNDYTGLWVGDRATGAIQLEPFTLTSSTVLHVQFRLIATDAAPVTFNLFTADPDGEVLTIHLLPKDFPLGEWVTRSFSGLDVEPEFADMVAAAAAGDLVFAAGFWAQSGITIYGDTSWLAVEVPDAAHPLRWRQRNDGLGGGSPRAARGVTSQQGSSRHRGYL